MYRKILTSIVLTSLFLTNLAHAIDATIINKNLEQEKIEIIKIDQKKIYLADSKLKILSTDSVYQITINNKQNHSRQPFRESKFFLADGQIISGAIIKSINDGQEIIIKNQIIGQVKISLENISKIITNPNAKQIKIKDDDQIQLRNGQILVGFVNQITNATIEIQIENVKKPTLIQLSNVKSIVLANPVSQKKDGNHMVTLDDNQKIKIKSIAFIKNQWQLYPALLPSKKISLSQFKVAKINLYTKNTSLIPLTRLNRSKVKALPVLGLKNKSKTFGLNLELHAPYAVTYEIPDGAKQFVANINLKDFNHIGAKWANCVFKILVNDKVIQTIHFDQKNHHKYINIPLKNALTMTLQIQPANNGPIMDKIIIKQPMILFKKVNNQ